MRTFFLSCASVAITASLISCSAQAQVKQSRQVADFHIVQSSGGIDVVLTQGPTTAVAVEAPAEAQPHLQTTVQGGTLRIGWEPGYSWKNLLSSTRKATVHITTPRLTGLSLSGGADATGESTFAADDFSIEASGGSDVKLALTAKSLSSVASGGSDLALTGRADRQSVDVSGGSDYKAFGLQSTTASVRASGGSDVSISVDSELAASASGGSDVRYKGNARLTSGRTSSVRHVQ